MLSRCPRSFRRQLKLSAGLVSPQRPHRLCPPVMTNICSHRERTEMSPPDVGSCKKWNATEGGHVAEPKDNETLTDDEIETIRIGTATRPLASTGDDGDDSGDTGDDTGDVS